MIKYLQQHLLNFKQKREIKQEDIFIFLRQFATLINSGVPILTCFDILEKTQQKMQLQLIIRQIKHKLLSGQALHPTLALYPQYFDSLTLHLIRMGEHSGKLDQLLIKIASHKEKQLVFNKQLKQILFYPTIIFMVAILTMVIMFIFVIPQFAKIFAEVTDKLPAITIFIFKVSSLLQTICCYYLFIFLLVIIIIYKKYQAFIHEHGKAFFLKLPIIKQIHDKKNLMHFAEHLAITLSAGLAIHDALSLSSSHRNQHFKKNIRLLQHKIISGCPLHQAMLAIGFPTLLIQMTKIGEESGQLEEMLYTAAQFFERELHHLLTTLTQLLEPLIMLVLGALIGGLVVAIYLPIFKLGNTL